MIMQKRRLDGTPAFPAVLLLAILLMASSMAEATLIKFATVIPEEGPGGKEMRALVSEIKEKTRGEADIRIYGGGIAGDEMDVIRKMRFGRIQMGAFSSIGLSRIVPAIRVLEMPGLYRDAGEIDYLRKKLFGYFAKAFEKEGFILLGFAEAGDIYLFSRKPVDDTSRLGDIRIFSWKEDWVTQNFFETLGMTPVPLHVTDVNIALETGMIDAFLSPALAAVAFQWHVKTLHILDFPLFNGMGALLMAQGSFNQLSPESQRILRNAFHEKSFEVMEIVRKQNAETMDLLRNSRIRMVRPEPDQMAVFNERLEQFVEKAVARGIFTRELIDQARAHVQTYRNRKK